MLAVFYVYALVLVGIKGQLFEIPREILQDMRNFVFETLDVLLSGCPTVNPKHIKYFYFNKQNTRTPIILDKTNINKIRTKKPTKIVLHGWYGVTLGPTSTSLADAYFKRGDYNVIVIHWEHYSNVNYAQAVCSLPELGNVIGDFIYNLYRKGILELNSTHIIGHSLGAHLAGHIGQRIQYRAKGQKLHRITGLDAAGPGFLGFPSYNRLDSSDAFFVDAIHTNGAQFGYPRNYGHVDFYPNCGLFQPGCLDYDITDKTTLFQQTVENLGCSHNRSVEYFIESINSKNFIATRFHSCHLLHKCRKGSNATGVVMGEDCPTNVKGSYCLTTNSASPYSVRKRNDF